MTYKVQVNTQIIVYEIDMKDSPLKYTNNNR